MARDPFILPTRPVIAGFHPDPSICRVADTYYLANSSFEYAPGVPIWRSSDMRSWDQVGHVLARPEQLTVDGVRSSGGIYAPTLRFHEGQFWMITTNVSDGPGQLLVSSPSAEGPWSTPVRVPDAIGIDPDLVWDDDGRCYLAWSGEQPAGEQGILQAELDLTTGRLLSPPCIIWRGTGGQYPEGPHLFRQGGFWYLVIAEGGTERGHAATVARSRSVRGPFEASPFNPLISARGSSSPVQNVGHADLVERPDGTWAAVYLGARVQGASPSWHLLGRETFASEVRWVDGWPVLSDPIEPGPGPAVTETLGAEVPVSWAAPSRHLSAVLGRADGSWMLRSVPDGPVFAGRRQQHFSTRTRAVLRTDAVRAGLELRIDAHHRVGLYVENDSIVARAIIAGHAVALGSCPAGGAPVLEIRTELSDAAVGTPRHAPDEIVLSVTHDGRSEEVGRIDGRYFSTEVAGGFTGRFVGVTVEDGLAGIVSFEYTGWDEPAAHA